MHAKRRERVNRFHLHNAKHVACKAVPHRLWTHHKGEATRLQRAAQCRGDGRQFVRIVEGRKRDPAVDPIIAFPIRSGPVDLSRHETDMSQGIKPADLSRGIPQQVCLFLGQRRTSIEDAVM